ncbi:flavodoxin family protein [Deinococcus sp. Marseille-Q6407]|uniref:flavodoxin family protein n=1 Tax=Deinococcus sp. Marseille-Q6407 TaxID=2969223 RepID=UPI0021BE0459|nr:NAD(P)H-dependent oxidoreductase [Deinococcus sp. Marseille-Q6407]
MTDHQPPAPAEFAGLRALFINCSLTKDSAQSHTGSLMSAVSGLMERAGAQVETVYALDYPIANGVYPDMREYGWKEDAWPEQLWPKVQAADILVIGTPLWLGEESSICRVMIERLYGMSGQLNEKGQSVFYGKVGGVVVTGNEDGVKHVAMSLTFALSHLGYTVPPQADCGWLGEIGPGPSYGDPTDGGTPVGFDNEFTQRNATIMAWNLLHLGRLLKEAGGLPNYGNDRNAWQNGERFGFQNPEPPRQPEQGGSPE